MQTQYVRLNNGIEIPLAGLVTWGMRGDECVRSVAAALHLGYRLIDTAQMYENETEVGKGIRQSGVSRDELFITTKIYRVSNSYEKTAKAIDASLRRLGTDYVDLLLLHEPYAQESELYRALQDALKSGKARAIGISNYDEPHYANFLRNCGIVPAVNQLEAHVYYQKWAFQKAMLTQGTVMQAWAPLAQGIDRIAEHPLLSEIGAHHGKTAAQVALRFLVQRGIPVIPKSRSEERLRENLAIFDFCLRDEEMNSIRTLDRNDTLFPWTNEF